MNGPRRHTPSTSGLSGSKTKAPLATPCSLLATVSVSWAGPATGTSVTRRRWPGYRYTAEHTIHVLESRWGYGIGRSLLIDLADHARLAGKRVLVAGIDSTNVRSIQFHAKMGFVEVARMPGIGDKWGRRLDLVLMQHDLEAPRK